VDENAAKHEPGKCQAEPGHTEQDHVEQGFAELVQVEKGRDRSKQIDSEDQCHG
jgi:hypothetical protein